MRRGLLSNDTLMLHEGVHVEQQNDLGFWVFTFSYVGEFFRHWIRNPLKPREAYRAISYEVEARRSEP